MMPLTAAFATVFCSAIGILSALLSREARNHHLCPPATIQKGDFDDASNFWKEIYSNLTQEEVVIIPSATHPEDDEFSLKSPHGIFDCVTYQDNSNNDDDTTALQCRSYGYMTILGRNIRYLFVHSDIWTIEKHIHQKSQNIRLTLNTTFNSVFDRMISTETACKKLRRAFLDYK